MDCDDPLGSEAEHGADESDASDRRWNRAVAEQMVVVPHVDDDATAVGIYDVLSSSRSIYTVDPSEPSCCCPDFVYREPEGGCKHIRRVFLQQGVDSEFPLRGDDAAAYLDRLTTLQESFSARRDLLAPRVFDDGDLAVSPDAPTEEYRTAAWFAEQLAEHDALE